MTTHEVTHDYHMVDPSPWPALAMAAAFLMASGLIMFMHDVTAWVLPIGFIAMLYTMFVWWRDVVQEATHQGDHTAVVQIGLRYGMALFIAAWLLLALLAIGSREHAETSPDEGLRKRVPRVLAASLIMGVLLFLAENLLQAAIDDPILRYPALAFLVAGGALVYGGTGIIFGAFRYRDILAALRPATARKRTAPGTSFVDSDSA